MPDGLPGAALFSCDWNAVRSPMAEGIAKRLVGTKMFVQSAGARGLEPLDPFAVEVCREIGVDISGHKTHTLAEMREWGDDLSQFDLIVALSPGAQRHALEAVAGSHVEVEYWPTLDPTDLGETREQKLAAYRQTRDQLRERLMVRFGLIL
ncbi:MAG: low molecular weight phosphatase family protein [Rubrimonas sp.]|uniref:arsenate-mycothiol transferase ArsC n=1 Tax=Rubrimonas sp. TaxID=2036015 RepID=UPI002FDEC6CA